MDAKDLIRQVVEGADPREVVSESTSISMKMNVTDATFANKAGYVVFVRAYAPDPLRGSRARDAVKGFGYVIKDRKVLGKTKFELRKLGPVSKLYKEVMKKEGVPNDQIALTRVYRKTNPDLPWDFMWKMSRKDIEPEQKKA